MSDDRALIDARKWIEMIDDKQRLIMCKYSHSRLTQESKEAFREWLEKEGQL